MSLLKGVYLIFFQLPETEIEVGKLGKNIFPGGSYVYVGSGMGGVIARVRRHLRGSQNKRWHIDYVLEKASEKQAVIFAAEDKHSECLLSNKVSSLAGSRSIVQGLGSSDCSCDTHLYFLEGGNSGAYNIVLSGCRKSDVLYPDSSALDDESQMIWQSYM